MDRKFNKAPAPASDEATSPRLKSAIAAVRRLVAVLARQAAHEAIVSVIDSADSLRNEPSACLKFRKKATPRAS